MGAALSVYIRILLYIVSGWLMSSGWINDELRQSLVSDPEAALLVQAAISGAVSGAAFGWRAAAKKFGWAT